VEVRVDTVFRRAWVKVRDTVRLVTVDTLVRVEYKDKVLKCVDCGAEFVFTAGEQLFFADKNFKNEPKRCKACKEQAERGAEWGQRLRKSRNHHHLLAVRLAKEVKNEKIINFFTGKLNDFYGSWIKALEKEAKFAQKIKDPAASGPYKKRSSSWRRRRRMKS
jgi:hypothetical protein